ncbi:MAG TPA: hypothetical protein K8U70_05245 [Facklamia tabacinasalis]|nr:hypothetical protein [Ruoffia tabacinasalis]
MEKPSNNNSLRVCSKYACKTFGIFMSLDNFEFCIRCFINVTICPCLS